MIRKIIYRPATDDKPFFDQNIGFSNLSWKGIKETFSQDDKAILALKDKPVAETTLIAILIQCIIIAGLLILLPLKFFKKENAPVKACRMNFQLIKNILYILHVWDSDILYFRYV